MKRRRCRKTHRGISTVIGTLLFILAAILAFTAFALVNIAQSSYQTAVNQASRLNALKAQEHLALRPYSEDLSDIANSAWVDVVNDGSVTSQLTHVVYVYHNSSGSIIEIIKDVDDCGSAGKILPPATRCTYTSLPAGVNFQDQTQRPAMGLVTSLGNTYWYNLTNLIPSQIDTDVTIGYSILVMADEDGTPVPAGFTNDGVPYTTPQLFVNLTGSHILEANTTDVNGQPFQAWRGPSFDGTNPIVINQSGAYVAQYGAPAPTYSILVTAEAGSQPTTASFTFDGITYSSPQVFTGVSGNHMLVAAASDAAGNSFEFWSLPSGATSTNPTVTVSSPGGTYTAVYSTPSTTPTTYSILVTSQLASIPAQQTSVDFQFDGFTYTSPHLFTVSVNTSHTITMPVTDSAGNPFLRWGNGSTTNPLTVTSGGVYTALFGYSIIVDSLEGSTPVPTQVSLDGGAVQQTPIGYSGLEGNHTVTVSAFDIAGHAFTGWSDGPMTTTRAVYSPGTYIALYGTGSPCYDFVIVATPSSGTVAASQTASTSILALASCGTQQPISLNVTSGMPPASTFSLNPSQGTPSFGSTLAIRTTNSTTPGLYNITVTGSSSNLTRTATYSLTVTGPPFDFALALSPPTATLTPGQSAVSQVFVFTISGTPQPVNLTIINPPAGFNVTTPSPSSGTPFYTSSFTVTTTNATLPGTYTIDIRGISANGVTHDVLFTVLVLSSSELGESTCQVIGSLCLDVQSFLYSGLASGILPASLAPIPSESCSGNNDGWCPAYFTDNSLVSEIIWAFTITNVDPSSRSITLEDISHIYFISSQAAATTAYFIVLPNSNATSFEPYPSSSSSGVTIAAGQTVTLYFAGWGPGSSSVQKKLNPSHSPFGSIIILIGSHSTGEPYAQTIPFVAVQVE